MKTPSQPSAAAGGSADRPLYPSDRAYVVQLCVDSSRPGEVRGRVEHVVSGRVLRFDDHAQLLRFLSVGHTQPELNSE